MFRIHSQDDGKKIIKNKKYMTLVAALYYINGLTVEPHCGTCYRYWEMFQAGPDGLRTGYSCINMCTVTFCPCAMLGNFTSLAVFIL